MVLDASERLAFALSESRGTYALLIGSGVSSGAGIPTGWGIILDLIKKMACLQEGEAPEDPEKWYRDHFGKDPDYSDLVEMLATTSTERQRLINEYIEPTEEEKLERLKQPASAHRAIAKLADLGIIRVIVTTNFDRLIENALTEASVPHSIISSIDDIEGMTPLTQSHHQCQVIKLHGDYKDVRSLNTLTELAKYPDRTNLLLDQIFDEFGMIVCGWSADWDVALCEAARRCKSQRFSWYWAHRGRVGDDAKKLIENRRATPISIQDAGEFFVTLQNRVQALLDNRRPHPASIELAVATLKRYMTRAENRVQMADLIREQAAQVAKTIAEAEAPHLLTVERRADIAEAACETLIAMATVAGRWMQKEHCDDWPGVLETLLYATSGWRRDQNSYLDAYPATLVFWSLCTGAIAGERYDTIKFLMDSRLRTGRDDTVVITTRGERVHTDIPSVMTGTDLSPVRWARLPDLHQRLVSSLTKAMGYVAYNDAERYRWTIDKFEVLWHLANAWRTIRQDPRRQSEATQQLARDYDYGRIRINCRGSNQREITQDLKSLIRDLRNDAPLVKSGLFGHSAAESLESIEFVEDPDSAVRKRKEEASDPNRY